MKDQRLLSAGLVTIVVLSVGGVGLGAAMSLGDAGGHGTIAQEATPTETPTEGNETERPDDETKGADELEETLNVTALNTTALDAAQIAQNETDAKPVAVKLGMENSTVRYGVLVVNDAGNVTGVVVNAPDGQVVRTVDNLGTINTTVLADQGGVANVTDLRSAVGAIRAAQAAAPQNAVPIEVALEAEPGMLLQQVTFAEPTDGVNNLTRVVVDATKGPVVGVIPPGADDAEDRKGDDRDEHGDDDRGADDRGADDRGTEEPGDAEETETEAEPPATETPMNETATEGNATETPSNQAAASVNAAPGSSHASVSQAAVQEDEDDGVFGDEVFAEDDEFDAGDDYGVIDYNDEVFGEQEPGQDAGADADFEEDGNEEADDDGLLEEEEEDEIEGDEEEEDDEFGDDDFGF